MKKYVLFGFLSFFLVSGLTLCTWAAGADFGKLKQPQTPVLTLQEALVRGIENNLDIKVSQSDVFIAKQGVELNKAPFDPYVDAAAYSSKDQTPTYASSYSIDTADSEKSAFSAGVGDKTAFGLRTRLSVATSRTSNNTTTSDLDPEFRSALILDITQPLLKDFGISINTSDLKVAKNQHKQAELMYTAKLNDLVRAIEKTYYELARAIQSLQFRIESRELALTLLQGNQKKFDSGVVPISEVQSAETIVASRDEQILYALQQAEVISDQLKDLLNIRNDDPLYDKLIRTEAINRSNESFPDLEMAVANALKNRPELAQMQLEIENKDIKLLYYKNQKLPRVDLVGTLGVNGLSGESRAPAAYPLLTDPSVYDGEYGDSWSSMTDADGYSWKVGLNFMYPLGNRYAKALFRMTEEGRKQAVYRYKRIEGRFETDVKSAMINVERSLERVEVADRFESLAAVSLEQEMKKLGEGLSDTFRIVNYQASLIEAKVRKATAMADFNKGLSDLYYSMGTLLDQHNMKTKFNAEETMQNEK